MSYRGIMKESGREAAAEYLLGKLYAADTNNIGELMDVIRHLGELKVQEAFEGLEELTGSKEYLLRECSLPALFNIDEKQAFPLIEKALKEDKEKIVRKRAAELLGEYSKKEEASEVLRKSLKDTSVDVRIEAAKSLGMLGNTDGHKIALEVLENEGNKYGVDERVAAIEALAEIGIDEKETIEAIEYFQKEECVACRALKSLRRKRISGSGSTKLIRRGNKK
jgi:HEAT repeat protein